MPTALDLFERHHTAVFRFLRRMGLGAADAEDATQDTFLRVLAALPGYEDRASERAWVFRIARNQLLDRWRSQARLPRLESIDHDLAGASGASAVDRLALGQALARLGLPEREAFLLREVGGLGYAEIADATGATPDAVRNRIHRARVALRSALEPSTAAVPLAPAASQGGQEVRDGCD
jgi:RNA polymerase sigma-70 factor (ECF subfamily)